MTKKRTIPGVSVLDVKIDMRVACRAFKDRHGEPEEWNGRLWYRDGWSRSAHDHRGPIWEPPVDPAELKAVQVRFWRSRRKFALGELERIARETKHLAALVELNPELLDEVELESGKTVTPLRQVVRDLHTVGSGLPGAGSQVVVRRAVNVRREDLGVLLGDRLERVKDAIDQCDRELEELTRVPTKKKVK